MICCGRGRYAACALWTISRSARSAGRLCRHTQRTTPASHPPLEMESLSQSPLALPSPVHAPWLSPTRAG